MTTAMIEKPQETTAAEAGTPESANSRARRLWNGNSEGTARLLLAELLGLGHDEAVEVLLPWITDRVRATVRADIRQAEAAAWGEDSKRKDGRKATAYRRQTGTLPVVNDLQRMLDLRVLVPGKDYVLWREMTVEDHQSRIGLLQRTVTGTMKTIGRHEWSIAEIKRHRNARCLGDIPVSKLSKDMT